MKFVGVTARLLQLGGLLLPAATVGWADTIPLSASYEAIACGGPGHPACTIFAQVRTPTASESQGLDNDLFRQYFGQQQFTWTITDSNDSGFIIGHVLGTLPFVGVIDTSFIFHAGQLTCCRTDSPFHLTDINDNNIVVGGNASGGTDFIGFADVMASDRHPVALNLINPPLHDDLIDILAADDQNRFLALGASGQKYMLVSPVPEPRSVISLVTAIGLIALGRLRRGRK